MIRKSITTALKSGVVALLLLVLLFADGVCVSAPDFIGSAFREVAAIFRDLGTQWMIFLCLGVYFTVFLFLRSRISTGFWRATNPNLWLACALLISAVLYAIDYSPSLDALTLLAGAVLGQGTAICAKLEGERQRAEGRNNLGVLVVSILALLLALASVWNVDSGHSFEYHSHARWSGPWYNPNIYGLLMGTGMALAVGMGIRRWMPEGGRWWKTPFLILCSVAAILMGRGLLHSYSRGAWLAVICGLAYLANRIFSFQFSIFSQRLRRNAPLLTIIVLSLCVSAFWQFQHTEHENMVARRAFSVGNVNDFSWRNRIAYWQGAMQIMAEKPWFGFGWNQPGPIYDQYYRAPKVVESMAIQLNDYLMLGATLGIPALFCFGIYIWLSLVRGVEHGIRRIELADKSEILPPACHAGAWRRLVTHHLSPQTICRAGVVVLLVGFWFDGGLFMLPTAAMFWILLELGSVELPQNAAKQIDEVPLIRANS